MRAERLGIRLFIAPLVLFSLVMPSQVTNSLVITPDVTSSIVTPSIYYNIL